MNYLQIIKDIGRVVNELTNDEENRKTTSKMISVQEVDSKR